MDPYYYGTIPVCRTSGLPKYQKAVCDRYPQLATKALEGLSMAVKECQQQFREHRWNCSSLATRSRHPYTSAIFQRGEF